MFGFAQSKWNNQDVPETPSESFQISRCDYNDVFTFVVKRYHI